MDVSKFTLDRGSSFSTSPSASYGYMDPSVLTKAYFDSKIYQDRAANYAFDISKIYGQQQQQQQQHAGQHLQMDSRGESSSTPTHLSPDSHQLLLNKVADNLQNNDLLYGGVGGVPVSSSASHIGGSLGGGGGGGGYSSSPTSSAGGGGYGNPGGLIGGSAAGQSGSATAADYRRPLTVIF